MRCRPWNYPIVLSLQPLYGAIAAGCCALLKLSELAPHYASFVARNLGKYVDPACFRVALGGVPEITAILELKCTHLPFSPHNSDPNTPGMPQGTTSSTPATGASHASSPPPPRATSRR